SLLELVFGVKVVITGDGFVPGERSVIIMNHRTRLDWMFLWCCLLRYSYLRMEKICLKAVLKAVPGFGWAMQMACFVFIQRRWEDDRRHLESMLGYFCDIREPLQLLLFPEGTDLTEYTRARSDEFADKNGLPKFEYVLHPRTTGFTFIVETLRKADNLDAIHDITVAYPKNIPQTERHLILGHFPREIHFHVRRYPVASLPGSSSSSAAELQAWCQERWVEKEARLRDFYSAEPRAFDQEGVARVPPCKTELRVALIKAASLLYWSGFIAFCFTALWMWVPVRLYCLAMVGVFLGQQKLIGGLELLELACHRYWKTLASGGGKGNGIWPVDFESLSQDSEGWCNHTAAWDWMHAMQPGYMAIICAVGVWWVMPSSSRCSATCRQNWCRHRMAAGTYPGRLAAADLLLLSAVCGGGFHWRFGGAMCRLVNVVNLGVDACFVAYPHAGWRMRYYLTVHLLIPVPVVSFYAYHILR
ncbi:hypothetical protein NHX12_020015, partial [Muraenolepis orangiensis]